MSEASIHSTAWTQDSTDRASFSTSTGSDDLPPSREASNWIGWVICAAMLLILVGTFQLVAGLVALLNEDYFQSTGRTSGFLGVDQVTWGIVQLVLGSLVILTGLGLLYGRIVARIVACCLALVGAMTSLLAIGAYPLWSVVLVTLNVLVLYAVAVHGEEMRPAR